MDKPVSMSIKDWIIRRMSVDMAIPESIIKVVINNQFEGATEAMGKVNSIEFSGFGKFYFKTHRAYDKMRHYELIKKGFEVILGRGDMSPQKERALKLKIENAQRNVDILKSKI
jgi:nucleoid DNA-binding protein